MSLRIVIMGTGTFALPAFTGLYDSAHEIVGLLTQPDRTGRGHHRHRNVLKELAVSRETPVFQPANVNTVASLSELRALNADLYVVAAYGQLLSSELLGIPRFGAINLHASLLPKYRGAAPILYAILNGETETGVSIFQIEKKLDAGPVFGTISTDIDSKETTGDLQERLSELAVPLTLRVVDEIASGTVQPMIQDVSQVTLAPTLRKSAGEIDWSQSTGKILCHLRAMQPWPNPFTFLHQSGRSALRVILLDADGEVGHQADGDANEPLESVPGTVVFADGQQLFVRTGDGVIALTEVRPEGKRAMPIADFLRGHVVQPGDCFAGISVD